MLRGFSLVLALVVLSSAAPTVAEAAPRRSYVTDKTFGVGIILGAPSGLSAKYFLSGGGTPMALAFALGAYHRYYYEEGLEFHVDWLWHPLSLYTNQDLSLPAYVGLGARVLDYDDGRDDDPYDEGTYFGIRAPVGIAFDLKKIPLDIFLEFALVIDLFGDEFRHHNHVDFNASFGFRFYF